MSERASVLVILKTVLGTVDIGVHIVHTSCVIIAYTMESFQNDK